MYSASLSESYFAAQTDEDVLATTVGGILREAAADAPGALALVEAAADGGVARSWTYGELLAEAEAVARGLAARFQPGERIAIWCPNTPEWAILEFAAGLAGLTLVTVNPAYQAKELRYVLEQSRAAGLFLVGEHRGNPMRRIAEEVCAGTPQVRCLVDIDGPDALAALHGDERPLPEVGPDDAAQIQYTSGTTGFPKGALLSHRSLTNNARFCLGRLGARAGEAYLNIMPMFHTAGCGIGVLGAVQHRCPLILIRMFDPLTVNTIIERQAAALVLAVPTMVVGMLEAHEKAPKDMSSLRLILSGGASVPPELARMAQDAFGCSFTIIYGQTETSPGLTQTRMSDPFEDRLGTVGQAYPQTELSIRDPSTGGVVQIGDVGEICARGYCNMIQYNDDPAATARTVDPEGWLHTGDLGTMDARGFVRVTGRLKEMIIRGGENLFPAEIENVLITHPGIAEAAVVGVPDAKWGEIAVCFLRAHNGATLEKAELVRHVRAELAAPKTPACWIVVDAFPVTASGKIQKFVLRDRFVAGEFDALTL
jgi:fatty-acyl-CoA synthase